MAKGGGKKSAKAQRDAANKLLADNRFARHQYEILETLECGLELFGTEVKSIRAGQSNLRDGFCLIRKGELQLHNVHISPHSHASAFFNHEPLRVRKLLAHRREIDKMRIALDQKGLPDPLEPAPQGLLDQADNRLGQGPQAARQASRGAAQAGHQGRQGRNRPPLIPHKLYRTQEAPKTAPPCWS